MSKAYDYQYHFASKDSGVRCVIGMMKCQKCGKQIDSVTQDWVSATKNIKDDWKYISWHRDCYSEQRGWADIEVSIVLYNNKVAKIKKELEVYKDKDGEFQNEFLSALEELGIYPS